MRFNLFYRFAGLGLAALAATADADTISAERPGFSSSPQALAAGRWQVEGGYQYSDLGSDSSDHTLPLLLVRRGLGEGFELQFGWAGLSRMKTNGALSEGANDASIALKWQLTDDAARTAVGLLAGVSLPIGDDDRSSDEVDPTLGLLWSHPLGSAGLFGTALVGESADRTSFGNSVGVGFAVDARLGAYLEHFVVGAEGDGPAHTLDGGFTYLVDDDMQLDLHAGVGLNGRAGDYFIGLGIARRWR